MRKLIVSDAGPMIALAKLDHLDLLLSSFSEIHLPDTVYLEITTDRHRPDAQRLELFIKAHCVVHKDFQEENDSSFRHILDEGEAQALSLAIKLNCAVLIDERLGRKVARRNSIPVVGVMGLLLQAKDKGSINAVKPLITQLLEHDYRLSERVIKLVLQRAGE